MRVIIITPEKLMELLQKQQQITMDNGWSSDPLKAFAHPPLPEAVEVPNDNEIKHKMDLSEISDDFYKCYIAGANYIINQLKLR
jgi:hypothetical protein